MDNNKKVDNNYFIDSDKLSQKALEKKHKLENCPECRTNHMEYMEGMERIESDIYDKVISKTPFSVSLQLKPQSDSRPLTNFRLSL